MSQPELLAAFRTKPRCTLLLESTGITSCVRFSAKTVGDRRVNPRWDYVLAPRPPAGQLGGPTHDQNPGGSQTEFKTGDVTWFDPRHPGGPPNTTRNLAGAKPNLGPQMGLGLAPVSFTGARPSFMACETLIMSKMGHEILRASRHGFL